MLPERSSIGNLAKSVFFEDVNEIDIYIEDTAFGYKKLFAILFSKVFDGTYKLQEVFPIGNRDKVIESHKNHSNERNRPSLYIIDGDLFVLIGEDINSQPGLFKLPFYCIENILICPAALHSLLDEEDTELSPDRVEAKFNLNAWLNKNIDGLFSLFIEYAITKKVNPDEQTVAYPVKNIVSNGFGDVDEKKLTDRINDLRNKSINIIGSEKYEETKHDILTKFNKDNLNKIDVISGKDYLFPLLKIRFRSTVKTKISDINIKQRLAAKCEINNLKQAINYVSSNFPVS